jgi:NADH-quinone oxidoreductase subunit L
MSPEVESRVHESPAVMTVPLGLLAVGAVVAGWVGIPHLIGQYLHHLPQYFEHFLAPVLVHPAAPEGGQASEGLEWGLMALSVAVALFGLWLARHFYLTQPAVPERLMSRFKHVYTTLLNKYWVDELYDLLFVNRTKELANRLAGFDNSVVDGAVNGSAWLTRLTASVSGFFDYWIVDLAVRRSDLIYYLSFPLRRIQTGVIQTYAALTIGGILLIVGYFILT